MTKHFPPSWQPVTLGELLLGIEAGKSFTCEPRPANGNEWGIIKVSAMTWGTFDERENKAIPEGKCFDPTKEVSEGDILLSRSNTAELVGATVLVGHCRKKLLLSDKSMRLLYSKEVSPRWLQRALAAPQVRAQMSKMANGTSDSMRNISQRNVLSIALALPSRTEQERIADTLDELLSDLDAGVESLQRAQAKLALFRASLLKAAVEGELTAEWRKKHPGAEDASGLLEHVISERRQRWERDQLQKFKADSKTPPNNWKSKYKQPLLPVTADLPALPAGWCWASLDQLCYEVRNGYSAKPDAATGVRMLRISAVRPLSLDLDDVRFLPGEARDYSSYLIASGDLLFTRYNGTKSLVAVCAFVPELTAETVHPDKLIRARLALEEVNARFVALSANVGQTRKFLESRIRTTAGQAGVSGTDIKQSPIPLPPASEQEELIDVAEDQLSILAQVERSLDEKMATARALRQAVLLQAFSGQLVSQDPNDEPASKLLERICAERVLRSKMKAGYSKRPVGRKRNQ